MRSHENIPQELTGTDSVDYLDKRFDAHILANKS